MTKYEARTPFGNRTYELSDDIICARGDVPLRGDFEIKLSLADLDPRFERFWLRSHWLTFGMWLFGAAMFAFIIETSVARMDGLGLVCLVTLFWMFASAVLIFVSLKKYEVARFKTKAGVGVLEVFEGGPMKASFQGFVEELAGRITRQNEKPA